MKKIYLFMLIVINGMAQNVTILPDGITPSQKWSYPRLAHDVILNLPNPQTGDIAYDLTFKCMRQFTGEKWLCMHQNIDGQDANIALLASEGGLSHDSGQDVAVDLDGNIYVVGVYYDAITFGSTTKNSAGNFDVYVTKYNASGTLQWVQTIGGPLADHASSIAVDASGSVFITGSFSGTATFGSITKTSAEGIDVFLVKYSTAGELQWVQSTEGTNQASGRSLALDTSGNIFVVGTFRGVAIFSGNTKTSAGGSDVFVAKYNTNGVVQWVQSGGGLSNEEGADITVDASGNVIITGSFENTTTFGNSTKTSSGPYDVLLACYNSNGAFQWLQTIGGSDISVGRGISVDKDGYIYVTGDFGGTINFGFNILKTSRGESDIFLAKFNAGGGLVWAKSMGGTAIDYGTSTAVDAKGNIYIVGSYSETATIENSIITSKGGFDLLIAKYNSFGDMQWVKSVGGGQTDSAWGITVDLSGNVYVTGYYTGTVAFGATTKTSVGSNDSFLIKLDN